MTDDEFKRIALISQSRLGDTLFNTPALRLLNKAFPASTIDVIAPTRLALQVWQNSPFLSHVYLCESPREANHLEHYDLAVAAYDNEFSRGCADRIASRAWLKSQHREVPPAREFLDFLEEKSGKSLDEPFTYDLYPGQEHYDLVAERLARIDFDRPLITCQVGCHGLSKALGRWFRRKQHPKVWPQKYYQRFIEQLLAACPNATMLLVGSDEEAWFAERLSKGERVHNFAGLDIPSLKVLIERSQLFISPDTGPLHVGCTTDTPLIAMYATTSPAIFGPPPGRTRTTVLQGDPITSIEPETVVQCALSWLGEKAGQ